MGFDKILIVQYLIYTGIVFTEFMGVTLTAKHNDVIIEAEEID